MAGETDTGDVMGPTPQMVVTKDFVVRRSELTCPGHSLKTEW